MRTKEFLKFLTERQRVLVYRTAGMSKPWTQDAILQSYRFCNVHREDDVVTQWIAENWRGPLRDRPNLWFWMLVARLINHPPTLQRLTPMAVTKDKWDRNLFIKVVEEIQARGDKAWGGAYIVSTNGNQMPKARYIADYVLTPAWQKRKLIEPMKNGSLFQFCCRLLTLNGVQGFIAGQVIADAKYADPYLEVASDWSTFAVSGPGSRRGLNRVIGYKVEKPWKEQAWKTQLQELRDSVNSWRDRTLFEAPIHAQDIQNCLCEFDKYERVRLGQGTPRSTYPGAV